ncbi:carboxymuconolactone decarboxylase family protein [Rhizosaccharibacter radicis]|uniref:Carboxymuconolactone decarboxylase family protein n=1 Tax=Rhizosaccharibacter radicis TaxID=2782605 RepID=A0ABT1W1P7_9PROT|nr:carboxymuconolactone decarboxylase family protein [Acetobacteraceae bacterium KSS12]
MPGPTPYVSSVAIPLPDDEHIRSVLGNSYDPAKALNVVKMFAGTDDMCDAALGLVRAVFAAEDVDPRLRQAIILRAATILNVPYEWQANVPMSLNNGLSQADIDAIGTKGGIVPAAYALVCAATDELSGTGTLTDATLQRLRDTHGNTGARKLVLMIAWFNLLSLFLNGCRVPMETTDKIGGKRSPLE